MKPLIPILTATFYILTILVYVVAVGMGCKEETMKGDLISRSELSKAICEKECKAPDFESIRELNIFLAGLNAKQIAVMECLGSAPTAYDVDKVVEKLEEEKGIAFLVLANTGDKMKDVVYDEVMAYLKAAIEIVKAGGVE